MPLEMGGFSCRLMEFGWKEPQTFSIERNGKLDTIFLAAEDVCLT